MLSRARFQGVVGDFQLGAGLQPLEDVRDRGVQLHASTGRDVAVDRVAHQRVGKRQPGFTPGDQQARPPERGDLFREVGRSADHLSDQGFVSLGAERRDHLERRQALRIERAHPPANDVTHGIGDGNLAGLRLLGIGGQEADHLADK
jgi:hypothetical protein